MQGVFGSRMICGGAITKHSEPDGTENLLQFVPNRLSVYFFYSISRGFPLSTRNFSRVPSLVHHEVARLGTEVGYAWHRHRPSQPALLTYKPAYPESGNMRYKRIHNSLIRTLRKMIMLIIVVYRSSQYK